MVLSLLFTATFVGQLGWDGDGVAEAGRIVRVVVWLLFGVDFVVRLRLSERPVRYAVTHPLDLLVLVAPSVYPVLVALDLVLKRIGWKPGSGGVVRRLLLYLGAVTTTLVVYVAVAVLLAEKDAPGANITTMGDALWWAAVTVTTVGYGDTYPVTSTGRVSAVLGMFVGIGVLGTVTATISAQVLGAIGRAGGEDARKLAVFDQHGPSADVAAVLVEVRALRAEVADLRAGRPAPPSAPAPAPGPASDPAAGSRPG